jgi:hypothetical protein
MHFAKYLLICATALLLAVAVLMIDPPSSASAQTFQCPAGTTQISGGGGIECQCPDGSLAGFSGCRGGGQQPYSQQPVVDCGDWTCQIGGRCSQVRYNGCVPNDYSECATGSLCGPGSQCTTQGSCMPVGSTECGNSSCRPGAFCGSRNVCMWAGSSDCGNGISCSGDTKCSRYSRSCIPDAAVDCPTGYCDGGKKCGSGNKCLAATDVDCGTGKSCSAGYVCRREGGCATPAQLAAEAEEKLQALIAKRAAERQARIEREAREAESRRAAAELKRQQDEGKRLAAESKRKADEEKREEARLKKQREIDFAKAKEFELNQELARKKQEAERKAAELKTQEDNRHAAALLEAKQKREVADKLLAERKELARIEVEVKKFAADVRDLQRAKSNAKTEVQRNCQTALEQLNELAQGKNPTGTMCASERNTKATSIMTRARALLPPPTASKSVVRLNDDLSSSVRISMPPSTTRSVVFQSASVTEQPACSSTFVPAGWRPVKPGDCPPVTIINPPVKAPTPTVSRVDAPDAFHRMPTEKEIAERNKKAAEEAAQNPFIVEYNVPAGRGSDCDTVSHSWARKAIPNCRRDGAAPNYSNIMSHLSDAMSAYASDGFTCKLCTISRQCRKLPILGTKILCEELPMSFSCQQVCQ